MDTHVHTAQAQHAKGRFSEVFDMGTRESEGVDTNEGIRSHTYSNADKPILNQAEEIVLAIGRVDVDSPHSPEEGRQQMYSTFAQFDRGSTINCISDKLVALRGYKVQRVRPILIKGLGGHEVSKTACTIRMDILGWQQGDKSKLGRITVYSRFMVTASLSIPILIGAPTMKEINATQSNLEEVTTIGWDGWDVRISVPHVPLQMVLRAQEDEARERHRGHEPGHTAIAHSTQAQVGYQDLLGLLSMRMQDTSRGQCESEDDNTDTMTASGETYPLYPSMTGHMDKPTDTSAKDLVNDPPEQYADTPLGRLRSKTATDERFWKVSEKDVMAIWATLIVDESELDVVDVYAVLQYVYEARNILSIWDDIFKLREDTSREELCRVTSQFLQAKRPLTLRQAQCRTYMTILRAWGDPTGDTEGTPQLPAIPKYIEPDLQAIIDDWNSAVEDDIIGIENGTHNLHGVVRPEYIPEDVWAKIPEEQLVAVQSRWERYSLERREFIQGDIDKMDICPDRPQQKEYVRALCWANVDAFYHSDPDNPPTIPNTRMRILTETEVPTVSRRQQQFTLLERTFLEVKTRIMLRLGQIEESESPYRAPVSLVQYPDRVKAFMEKHGENALTAMKDTQHEAEVATFYRLTIDLRLLNAATIADKHPLP